ncbi:MAG: HlyC/CorC family transporter [Peptococcaceae bacterium]|nr:HlyC/CorC family transporter [Peptococcaceae bacterium]
MLTEILVLVILIALNAFFAASEMALVSLNDTKIRIQAEGGNKKAQLIVQVLGEPSRFLATIQVGITLAGFLASAFASDSFSDEIVRLFKAIGLNVDPSLLKSVSMVLITIILSYFTLVFGELVPKRLAMKRAERISSLAIRPILFLSVLTYPFVKFLTLSTNFFLRLIGIDPNQHDEEATEEEIRMMVEVGGERGTIEESEKVMINNVFEFNNKTVAEIMTHRTNIASLPVEADLDTVMDLINEEKYSRIPVYEGNIDNIVGVLQIKDLIEYLSIHGRNSSFDLRQLIRQPYIVPASKRTDELFRELQRNKTHLAIVIDEYGGTAGLVTIEDLIEEIVGNIFDEYDEEEKEIDKLDENTYIIDGSTSLDTVNDYLRVNLPIEDYETLSGFLIGQLGRIPKKDDKPTVEFNGLLFKVEAVEDRKITKIKVCKA